MAEKRIFCIEVNGECRHLRVVKPYKENDLDTLENAGLEPGTYCAAYYHSAAWERIDPKECKKCKREKYLEGISRQEAVERMAKAMCSCDGESCKSCAVKNNKYACKSVLHDELFMQYAEAAIDALLGKE